MAKLKEIVDGNLNKIYIKYLIPSVGGMLGTSLYVLGDTMIVGRGLGSAGLAALNLSIPIINLFTGLGLLFGIGGATAVSVDRGKGKTENINRIFTKSMVLTFMIGLFLTLFRIFFLDEFVSFLGAEGDIFLMSRDYLAILMSFSIPFLLNTTLMVFVRNDGAPKTAMAAMLIGSVFNVLLDYLFIIKLGWGMSGGALATGLAPVLGILILSSHFLKKKNKIKFQFPKGSSTKLKRIISNGIPSFIVEFSAGIVIFAFNQRLLKISGNLAVSAYSIIANLSLIAYAIFTGVGQAIQPIVSINYGAKNKKRILKTVKLGIFTAFSLGMLFFLSGLLFPEKLISLFIKDSSEIIDITRTGIKIYFSSFLLMGVNTVMTSYVQSKEQAKTSMIISLTRGLVLIIGFLMILSRRFGIIGVWLSLPMTELTVFILSTLVFKKLNRAVKYLFKPIPMTNLLDSKSA
ncbi:MAG: MATE family efflux transporter [Tissierellia bacterium]|nr:MATE family efflux transporter [Tissierellia bacterium]